MQDILRTIILDNQDATPNTGIARRLHIEKARAKATVIVGVRRSGKSTFLMQMIRHLLDDETPAENMLLLNFFDDRLFPLRHIGAGACIDAYFSLFPEKKHRSTVYCFFDEIQIVPGWEAFVDRLLRTEKCEVVISGSSAQLLSKEVATQMRGRSVCWEMFPFSFVEFLDWKEIPPNSSLTSKTKLLFQKAYHEYFECGGFPEVLTATRLLRIKIHQEYVQAILFRDLVERHDVTHPRAVSDLAHYLIENVASLYSVNRLSGYLKSLGHNVPKATVSLYVSWFEDAYFLFSVRLFDRSVSRSNANPKKIYCIDHALVTSVASGISLNSGHLLENLVFIALRRNHSEIFYYKTAHGREVDFCVPIQGKEPLLVQVCESMAAPSTRQREVTALHEAMLELSLDVGIIVTKSEEEVIAISDLRIRVLPAWRFLLEITSSYQI